MRALTRLLAALAVVSLFVLGVVASSRAFAAADDRTITERLVGDLDRDVAHKALTADAARRSRDALERGTRMRQSGDEVHAKIADGVAREWAEIARDLVRTTDGEKKAFDARRDATDAGAQAERERALLEEALAQNGRLRTQLDAIDHDRKEEPTKTSKVGAALDAGPPQGTGGGGGAARKGPGNAAALGTAPGMAPAPGMPSGATGSASLDGGGP